MSKEMEAMLILCESPIIGRILMPILEIEKERIAFERLNYGVLSGGEKTVISWAIAIWTDHNPDEREFRDPFEGFGVLSRDLQELVLKALLHRYS